MRTPNCVCIVCSKPMYRRPHELAKVRHVACMEHRAEAQKISGITDAQQRGLALGRPKGTNHRTGYKHREESKRKVSASNKAFWAAHPDQAAARGAKTRGERNRLWKGGITLLNKAVRTMSAYRNWTRAVRYRDGKCLRCGATEDLESHHITELVVLFGRFSIKTVDDARACDALWNVDNGETLCEKCHCAEHGRQYSRAGNGRKHRPRKERRSQVGASNSNYKGGKVAKTCLRCQCLFSVKQCQVASRKYCSRECCHGRRRIEIQRDATESPNAFQQIA